MCYLRHSSFYRLGHGMSPENVRMVRESWELALPVSNELVTAFYARLFRANPALSKLFEKTDMKEQRRKFIVMMSEIIRVIDQPQLLVSEVADSGRRHVTYGVHDRDYEDVGAALLAALGDVLNERFTPQVRAAWREAYDLLAAVMRRAAGQATASGTPASLT